jgi:hypothetical protein
MAMDTIENDERANREDYKTILYISITQNRG